MTHRPVPRAFVAVSTVLIAIATVTLTLLVRLWHDVGELAELLSDAGHGPTRWREDSDLDNPFAGEGPIPPDDRHPERDQ
jgi:hypothetical protein